MLPIHVQQLQWAGLSCQSLRHQTLTWCSRNLFKCVWQLVNLWIVITKFLAFLEKTSLPQMCAPISYQTHVREFLIFIFVLKDKFYVTFFPVQSLSRSIFCFLSIFQDFLMWRNFTWFMMCFTPAKLMCMSALTMRLTSSVLESALRSASVWSATRSSPTAWSAPSKASSTRNGTSTGSRTQCSATPWTPCPVSPPAVSLQTRIDIR